MAGMGDFLVAFFGPQQRPFELIAVGDCPFNIGNRNRPLFLHIGQLSNEVLHQAHGNLLAGHGRKCLDHIQSAFQLADVPPQTAGKKPGHLVG